MSNITFSNINENFPVAGQDNDTQVFRDNFDSIKTALSVAKTEIEDLESNAARTDQDSDFNTYAITNAKFINNVDVILAAGAPEVATGEIDFLNGHYQIFTISGAITFNLQNFPNDGNGVGKVRIELYGTDASSKLVQFTLSGSGATTVKSDGFPGFASGLPQITLTSATTAIIFDIWRHTESTFFMQYIGSFS